jgi:peptidoglycan/LPS O-acetylase OafA/YrhL
LPGPVNFGAITTEFRAGKTGVVPPHLPYFPAVDGLRFVSFLLVFIHHLDPKFPALALLGQYGWAGVEVFFAISSFLFFTLLDREFALFGKINILKFFYRRALRIYPLMFLFATMMFLLSAGGGRAIARYIGILTLSDNYMVWIDGYDSIIPFTAHLWTLSYEFQIYLLIPLAFLIYKTLGRERFLVVVVCVWALSFAARAGFILLDAKHPLIWVTPFLRPESTLAGIAIALGVGRRTHPLVIAAILLCAVYVLTTHPNGWTIGPWTLFIYPVCGVVSGSALLLALNHRSIVHRLLSQTLIVFLGTISFGLYVFHLWGMILADRTIVYWGIHFQSDIASYAFRFGLALALTVVIATVSWFAFEQWFLSLKAKQEVYAVAP